MPKEASEVYHKLLGRPESEPPPPVCGTDIARAMFELQLRSPAMLAIFPLQDIFALSPRLTTRDPASERINTPFDYTRNWQYRMHVPLEQLVSDSEFTEEVAQLLGQCGRAAQPPPQAKAGGREM
eukprot:TRINITY_DN2537_c0_g1_i25.p2 TRINITY_DN2537_c0_g1~~TRINITY_DN2537_c0_g1_i25.p2  ORF type:complete len:125 (-),score=32.92 TRINITY_DN2537_c0_g1_i25:32-406(-)